MNNNRRSSAMSTATASKPDASRTIPSPANFPVRWEQPGDERLFWTPDLMHYPDPMYTLEFEMMQLYPVGFNLAAEAFELPVRMHARHINTYYYQSMVPVGAPPEPVLKVMKKLSRFIPGIVNSIQSKAVNSLAKKYNEKMTPVIARLQELWDSEWLPEVMKYVNDCERFDLRGASMKELLAHWDDIVARNRRIGEIHFLVGLPMLLVMSDFEDIYSDIFGRDRALDAYKLMQGYHNKSVEAGHILWNLSREALAKPDVRRVLEEEAARDVIAMLERSADGNAFAAKLRDYLKEYGERGDKFSTMGDASWIEDPSPMIKVLKDYITQEDRDPAAEMEKLARERERYIAEARNRLKGYPQPVRDRFEMLLEAVKAATILHEDHNYWIDQRCLYQLRVISLEFGRRFAAAGVILNTEDVLHLTNDELRETALGLPSINRREIVALRRAERERFRNVPLPRALGREPLMGPPDDQIGRTVARFFGEGGPSSTDPNVLRGFAGSPGKVLAKARVVRSLAEASKLVPGEVLVAETTAPPWTPLFATAAAIVTDTGGVLSHCAVVAREYNIPAVVGTRTATATIKDGQLLEVDGSTGTVRIVPMN
jgi:pyruvate,water dikinase